MGREIRIGVDKLEDIVDRMNKEINENRNPEFAAYMGLLMLEERIKVIKEELWYMDGCPPKTNPNRNVFKELEKKEKKPNYQTFRRAKHPDGGYYWTRQRKGAK